MAWSRLRRKNRGSTIRCTIVSDIGVSVTQPQPVARELMEDVMRESMQAGSVLPQWAPHKGRVAAVAAGGIMGA